MKIVLSWLKDFIALNPGVDAAVLEHALIGLGHEVDGIHETGAALGGVVVGHIVSREQHPNADRLGVCMVDVGDAGADGQGELRQIVCGAANARAGLTVAVALPGAELPGKDGAEVFRIGEGVIRGVASRGMICSQRELGLGDGDEGIWELDAAKLESVAAGAPLMQALGQAAAPETVLDVSVTPNRGDCLSHNGVARELAAAGLGAYQLPGVPQLGASAPALAVATQTADCPLLLACVVRNVRVQPSPGWVQARLTAAGLRPRNAVVDATNYVMLSLGQPLHAYDADKLGGALTVDAAANGDVFAGLNGINLNLRGGEVVLRDGQGAVVALGGILGGQASAVSDATTTVVLEAAYFERGRTALTGQAHGVHTDARSRFERGVDPAAVELALRQCAAYIADWCGADAKQDVSAPAQAGAVPAAAAPIGYAPGLMARFGGLDVPAARQREILQTLGFSVDGADGDAAWMVQPPSWRTYMQTPEDVVEEVLRVVGYDAVPSVLPPLLAPSFGGGQIEIEQAVRVEDGGSRPVMLDRLARRVLASSGVMEVLSYSFIGRSMAERFAAGDGERAQLLEVANPLAETSMTTMRPSLLPGLLQVQAANLARHEGVARLGEVGKVFTQRGERLMAAVLLSAETQRHWRTGAQGANVNADVSADVFGAKGLAEALLAQLGAPVASAQVSQGGGTAVYHPGRSGTLQIGPFLLARFGELHPALRSAVAKELDIHGPLAVVELELEPLLKLQAKAKAFSMSSYPPVKRDLAFVLPETVAAAAVQATILKSAKADAKGGGLLRDVQVFDVYQGDKVPAGQRSLALALTLQADDRTLSEVDINGVLTAAVQAVQAAHGGELRA